MSFELLAACAKRARSLPGMCKGPEVDVMVGQEEENGDLQLKRSAMTRLRDSTQGRDSRKHSMLIGWRRGYAS